MFYWWLNNGRDVTYERLGCGLRGIEETNLATQLCEQHLNGQQTHLHIQREFNVRQIFPKFDIWKFTNQVLNRVIAQHIELTNHYHA